jgi:hypothetical protein
MLSIWKLQLNTKTSLKPLENDLFRLTVAKATGVTLVKVLLVSRFTEEGGKNALPVSGQSVRFSVVEKTWIPSTGPVDSPPAPPAASHRAIFIAGCFIRYGDTSTRL